MKKNRSKHKSSIGGDSDSNSPTTTTGERTLRRKSLSFTDVSPSTLALMQKETSWNSDNSKVVEVTKEDQELPMTKKHHNSLVVDDEDEESFLHDENGTNIFSAQDSAPRKISIGQLSQDGAFKPISSDSDDDTTPSNSSSSDQMKIVHPKPILSSPSKGSRKDSNGSSPVDTSDRRRKNSFGLPLSRSRPSSPDATSSAKKFGKKAQALITKSVKKVLLLNNNRMFPEMLNDMKFHSHSQCHFVGNQMMISFYSNTGSILFLNFANCFASQTSGSMASSLQMKDNQHRLPYKLENNSAIITWQVLFPLMVSVHENGIVQIYDMLRETSKKIAIPEIKSLAANTSVKHNYSVLISQDYLFLITTTKILEYERAQMTKPPREILLSTNGSEGLVELKQSLTHLIDSHLIFIGSSFNFCIVDISDRTSQYAKFIATGSANVAHQSYLATYCSRYNAVLVHREAYSIWRLGKDSAKFCREETLQDIIVTAVHLGKNFIFIGFSNGLISVLNAEDGQYCYDLNSLSSFNLDLSTEKITGISFNNKVNCIKKVGKWLVAGFQNGSICIYDTMERFVDIPAAEYRISNTKEGHIKQISVENGYVYAVLQVAKKPVAEDKKKLVLLSWQPNFRRKEEYREFQVISAFFPKSKVGREFESSSSTITKIVLCGSILMTAHKDRSIRAWDKTSGTVSYSLYIPTLFSTPDTKVFYHESVIVFYRNNMSIVYFPETNKWGKQMESKDILTACKIYGDFLYTGHKDGTVQIWEYKPVNTEPTALFHCHHAPVTTIYCDDDILYTGSEDCLVKAFQLAPGKKTHGECKQMFMGHTGKITDIVVLTVSYSKALCSTATDNTIRMWDRTSLTCVRSYSLSNQFKPDFSLLLDQERRLFMVQHLESMLSNFNVFGFSVKSGKILTSFEHGEAIKLISLVKNVNRPALYTVSEDEGVRNWDPLTGELLNTFYTFQANITALLVKEDYIYTGDDEGKLVELDLKELNSQSSPSTLILSSTPTKSDEVVSAGSLSDNSANKDIDLETKYRRSFMKRFGSSTAMINKKPLHPVFHNQDNSPDTTKNPMYDTNSGGSTDDSGTSFYGSRRLSFGSSTPINLESKEDSEEKKGGSLDYYFEVKRKLSNPLNLFK